MSLSVFHLFTLDSKDKLLVNGLHSAYVEPLRCLLFNTLNISVEKNSQWQLQFTAYDDGSLAFQMLSVEASVWWSGQEYIVKQFQEADTTGFTTYQVAAIHVAYDVQRVRQRQVKTGTLTYTVESVLSFYLAGNSFGYTWQVIGNFGKEQITDLGNSSGKDMLDKIVSTWPDAIFYPDNKNIRIYQHDSLAKNLGNRIDYLHNTPELKLSFDSTELVNEVMCYGKQKESEESNSVEYYFQPFLVSDQKSITQWGLHPGDDISDERFTDQRSMQLYALSKLTPEPSLSIEVTELVREIPTLSELRRLEIRNKNFVTEVEVVAFTYYPLDKAQATNVTLNNSAKTILDYRRANNDLLIHFMQSQQSKIKSLTESIKKRQEEIETLRLSGNNMQGAIDKLNEQVAELSWTSGSLFVDLSSNNGLQTGDWYENLAQAGVKGAIVKLTENVDYINDLFSSQVDGVTDSGMKLIGTYHYLKATTVAGAKAEAQWYVKQLQSFHISSSLLVCCDIEDDVLSDDKNSLNEIIAAFYQILNSAGYVNTVDYSSESWFGDRFDGIAKYKWIASWDAPNKPARADAWQYTKTFNGLKLDANRSYNRAFA